MAFAPRRGARRSLRVRRSLTKNLPIFLDFCSILSYYRSMPKSYPINPTMENGSENVSYKEGAILNCKLGADPYTWVDVQNLRRKIWKDNRLREWGVPLYITRGGKTRFDCVQVVDGRNPDQAIHAAAKGSNPLVVSRGVPILRRFISSSDQARPDHG